MAKLMKTRPQLSKHRRPLPRLSAAPSYKKAQAGSGPGGELSPGSYQKTFTEPIMSPPRSFPSSIQFGWKISQGTFHIKQVCITLYINLQRPNKSPHEGALDNSGYKKRKISLSRNKRGAEPFPGRAAICLDKRTNGKKKRVPTFICPRMFLSARTSSSLIGVILKT